MFVSGEMPGSEIFGNGFVMKSLTSKVQYCTTLMEFMHMT